MEKRKQKIIVAMSGGVDSSVAAALLKRQGYEVIGVFMHFWAETRSDASIDTRYHENRCCSLEAYSDARRVAGKLDIPFYTMNLKIPFKKWVVDYFLKEYQAGRTPNPCVECNRFIKFGELLRKARAMGADFVATGHYARVVEDKRPSLDSPSRRGGQKIKDKRIYRLLKGKDKKKDQSYFLYTLMQEQLKHILFPVGSYTKPQVRKMAKKFGLPVHAKKDSQEICFVGARLQEFLKKWLEIKSGKLVELETGKVLGKHGGLPFYTIGQRKGLGLGGGPFYVAAINVRNNKLYVSRDPKKLFSRELIAEKVNWIIGREPKLPVHLKARIRYKHKEESCIVKREKNVYKVIFDKSQRAITPGQSVVFYRGDEAVGGGIIE